MRENAGVANWMRVRGSELVAAGEPWRDLVMRVVCYVGVVRGVIGTSNSLIGKWRVRMLPAFVGARVREGRVGSRSGRAESGDCVSMWMAMH